MFSSAQLLELFIVLSIADQFRGGFSTIRTALANAQAKSGPVRSDTVPTGFLGAPFTALQFIVSSLVPAVYLFAVVGAGLQQPQWMEALALPEVIFGVRIEGIWKSVLRVLARLSYVPMRSIASSAFEHLGDQYHPIGRRQKPRVVQTGPYAWVRHPLYSLALLQPVIQCLIFWSYAPLFMLVATAAIFAVKIRIEEEAIQRDGGIREEYRAYMRKVPAKFVPYIW